MFQYGALWLFLVWLCVGLLVLWYILCWVRCFQHERHWARFFSNAWRCLTFRVPLAEYEGKETSLDGGWADGVRRYDCQLCYRPIWAIGKPPIYLAAEPMVMSDPTLPPAVRKRQVCLTCLVRVTGGRLARKRFLTVATLWPESGWTWRLKLKRFWFGGVQPVLFPFGGDGEIRKGLYYLRVGTQYKWHHFFMKYGWGVLASGTAFGAVADALTLAIAGTGR